MLCVEYGAGKVLYSLAKEAYPAPAMSRVGLGVPGPQEACSLSQTGFQPQICESLDPLSLAGPHSDKGSNLTEGLGEEARPEARPPALTKPDSSVCLWGTSLLAGGPQGGAIPGPDLPF